MKQKNVKMILALLVCVVAFIFNWVGQPDAEPASQAGNIQSAQSDTEGTQYTFRSEKLFISHFEKHGAEFGDITKEEYLQMANELISSTTAHHKTEKEDGDDVFYEEEDNTFLILSKDGYIRTFFKPSGGKDYYERQ